MSHWTQVAPKVYGLENLKKNRFQTPVELSDSLEQNLVRTMSGIRDRLNYGVYSLTFNYHRGWLFDRYTATIESSERDVVLRARGSNGVARLLKKVSRALANTARFLPREREADPYGRG